MTGGLQGLPTPNLAALDMDSLGGIGYGWSIREKRLRQFALAG